MVEKREWQDFVDTGLFFACNQFLHFFGWAIVRVIDDESGDILEVYPARTKFRGSATKKNCAKYYFGACWIDCWRSIFN